MGLFGNSTLSPGDRKLLCRMEAKLDLLLAHVGLQYVESTPLTTLSLEARRLATDGFKIEAIKVHRQATGLGLAEAKAEVEAFMDGGR
jgi:ribosomal protein L7/L12